MSIIPRAVMIQIKHGALRAFQTGTPSAKERTMYQRILVPVDGSPTSDLGLAEAIKLAKLTGGRLCLLHVIDELSLARSTSAYGGYSTDWLAEMRASGAKVLADAHTTALTAGISAEERLADNFQGAVHEVVCAEAASWPRTAGAG